MSSANVRTTTDYRRLVDDLIAAATRLLEAPDRDAAMASIPVLEDAVEEAKAFVAPRPMTDQQRAALGRGNAVRSARAQLKRDVKARRVSFADALRRPEVAPLKVADLIEWAPQRGRSHAAAVMRAMHLTPAKLVGHLTDRQVDELVSRTVERRPPYGAATEPGARRAIAGLVASGEPMSSAELGVTANEISLAFRRGYVERATGSRGGGGRPRRYVVTDLGREWAATTSTTAQEATNV